MFSEKIFTMIRLCYKRMFDANIDNVDNLIALLNRENAVKIFKK
jgi:hypothetical protein